jgi:hypothetical protein
MSTEKTFNLGRDEGNHIVIDDKHASVSHYHASITINGDTWILTDRQSKNGTYIEEDGQFRRYERVNITPSTWIRLGEQGHRGYYFKARRVIKPNDYREDFAELYEIFQEYETAKKQLESHRRTVKFITPVLMCIGLILSFLPCIRNNGLAVRASFMLPGFVSPFLQDILLNKLEGKIKKLQEELICPKCRRTLGKDDILNRSHTFCHAQ